MLSVGKVAGFVYAAIGLLVGGIVSFVSVIGAAFGAFAEQSPEPLVGLVFGAGAIVIFPVFYGVTGFIGGLISALVYNAVAAVVGGVEIELG